MRRHQHRRGLQQRHVRMAFRHQRLRMGRMWMHLVQIGRFSAGKTAPASHTISSKVQMGMACTPASWDATIGLDVLRSCIQAQSQASEPLIFVHNIANWASRTEHGFGQMLLQILVWNLLHQLLHLCECKLD